MRRARCHCPLHLTHIQRIIVDKMLNERNKNAKRFTLTTRNCWEFIPFDWNQFAVIGLRAVVRSNFRIQDTQRSDSESYHRHFSFHCNLGGGKRMYCTCVNSTACAVRARDSITETQSGSLFISLRHRNSIFFFTLFVASVSARVRN